MTLARNVTMNGIREYVGKLKYGEPVLLNNIVHDLCDNKDDVTKTRNTVSACLNRLAKNEKLGKFDYGVFYKTKKNIFGEYPINYSKLINKIYMYDEKCNNRIGFYVGIRVLEDIGITNNLENRIEIVTNNYNKKRILTTINQNICLKRPIIEINNDNYLYLQLLETIKEINKYHLTNELIGEKLTIYMKKNGIKVDKLFRFAKQHYDAKTIRNLVNLLAM